MRFFLGEIRLCAFLAEHHLPFAVMDHLVKTVANVCTDSEIAKRLACGRTKSSAIIKNILGPHSLQSLIADLRTNKFSLIVDESTDIGTMKHLCLVVRRVVKYNVTDDFLTLLKLSAADATTMYNHIINFFETNKIPYRQNLIGFASDGANVMVGEHHSLAALLKKDIPNLYTIKCICHSFHLCASYACQKIPRFVEDLTRDIYNYFASSPKRVTELEKFQIFCNAKVHKILHPSQTRWLSVHSAVARILEQYGPLQLYFTDAVSNNDLLAAENILTKLNDPTTKLFLLFLDFALPFFNDLNREMQSEKPKLHLLYKNICNILRTIFDCFIKRNYLLSTPLENIDFKNPANYLAIEDVYFGANAIKYISENRLSNQQLHFFRLRALDFYIEACAQIVQRFPLKNNPLSKFLFLDPTVVKSGTIQSISDVAILFPNILSGDNNLQLLDTQWRLLRNTKEIESLPEETVLFWKKINDIQSGDGTQMFNILSDFVFTILCLPHSSANVERIFSDYNLTKTKLRANLNTDTTSGLLHTRQYLQGKNCYEFTIQKELLKAMTDRSVLYGDNDKAQNISEAE